MSFKDFPNQAEGVQRLQRSLERNRVAQAYLFTGPQIEDLEGVASTLAKTLNCLNPVLRGGASVDCCDRCSNCSRIQHGNFPEVHWIRPESRTRVITIEQVRTLLPELYLKPAEAERKMAVIAGADRMNSQAANAFLKTLEEPPEDTILLLLSTDPQRILETILSRCLRVNFGGNGGRALAPAEAEWLSAFSEMAAGGQSRLLERYRLLDVLLQKLSALKSATEDSLRARSPLEQYAEADKELRDRWEDELTAAIEAEYRRQRSELLLILQRWFRDVWLRTLAEKRGGRAAKPPETPDALLEFPQLAGTTQVASRIGTEEALENIEILERTHGILHTNVQEALALEVGLLKLHL